MARPELLVELLHGESLEAQVGGAVYHVMARGDGGKAIFTAQDAYLLFLHLLGHLKVG